MSTESATPSLSKLSSSLSPQAPPIHQACILTILRVIDNILSDPTRHNPKLRKIKVSNPAFWKRAGQWEGCIAFLIDCGFTPSGSGESPDVPAHLKFEGENEEKRRRLAVGRGELVKFAVRGLGLQEKLLPICPVQSQSVTSDTKCNANGELSKVDLPAEASGTALKVIGDEKAPVPAALALDTVTSTQPGSETRTKDQKSDTKKTAPLQNQVQSKPNKDTDANSKSTETASNANATLSGKLAVPQRSKSKSSQKIEIDSSATQRGSKASTKDQELEVTKRAALQSQVQSKSTAPVLRVIETAVTQSVPESSANQKLEAPKRAAPKSPMKSLPKKDSDAKSKSSEITNLEAPEKASSPVVAAASTDGSERRAKDQKLVVAKAVSTQSPWQSILAKNANTSCNASEKSTNPDLSGKGSAPVLIGNETTVPNKDPETSAKDQKLDMEATTPQNQSQTSLSEDAAKCKSNEKNIKSASSAKASTAVLKTKSATSKATSPQRQVASETNKDANAKSQSDEKKSSDLLAEAKVCHAGSETNNAVEKPSTTKEASPQIQAQSPLKTVAKHEESQSDEISNLSEKIATIYSSAIENVIRKKAPLNPAAASAQISATKEHQSGLESAASIQGKAKTTPEATDLYTQDVKTEKETPKSMNQTDPLALSQPLTEASKNIATCQSTAALSHPTIKPTVPATNDSLLTSALREEESKQSVEMEDLLLAEIYQELDDDIAPDFDSDASIITSDISPQVKGTNGNTNLWANIAPLDQNTQAIDTAHVTMEVAHEKLCEEVNRPHEVEQVEVESSDVYHDVLISTKCHTEPLHESELLKELVETEDMMSPPSRQPVENNGGISVNEEQLIEKSQEPTTINNIEAEATNDDELHHGKQYQDNATSEENHDEPKIAENKPGLREKPTSFHANTNEKYRLLFREIPLPEGEFSSPDDAEAEAFFMGFELCHRLLISLWYTENSLRKAAVQQQNITKGLANVKPWTECSFEENVEKEDIRLPCSNKTSPLIIVPLAFVYQAWTFLLNLQDYATTRSRSIYSWILSNHPDSASSDIHISASSLSIFANTPEINSPLCNYVCNALRKCGLVTIFAADIVAFSDDVPPELTFFIGVDDTVLQDCIKDDNSILLDENLANECHERLAHLVLPCIQDLLEKDTLGPIESASLWYSCQSAVHHLLSSDQLEEAERLMLDQKFARARLKSMGISRAINTHCWECSRMTQCQTDASKMRQSMQLQAADESSCDVTSKDFDFNQSCETWRENSVKSLCNLSAILLETAESLSADSSTRRIKKEFGDAFQTIGESIGSMGGNRKVEMDQYEHAMIFKTEAYNDKQNHESIADTLYAMGCFRQKCGDFALGQKCYEQALKIYKAALGYDHPCVARVLHNIGIMYASQKNYDVAMKCLKKSLSMRQCALGDNDISLADSLCWVGNIHRERKELNKARECFVKAHQVKVAVLGYNHPECTEIMQNLGIICHDLQLYSQSLSYYKEAMLSRRANISSPYDVQGIDDLSESLHCIANVYRATGQFQRALQFSEQILKRRKAVAALSDKGHVTKLIRTYEDIIALTKLVSRDETGAVDKSKFAEVGGHLVEIGKLHEHRLKKPMKALLYYQDAMDVFKQLNDYRQIQCCLNLMGTIHVHSSSTDKALACFSKALLLTMSKKSPVPQQSLCSADLLHNIGNCLAKQGEFKKSMVSYRDSLKIKKALLPPHDLSVGKTEHCLALSLVQLGEVDEALSFFQSSMSTRVEKLGSDHLDVGFSLHNIGKIFFHQGKFDEAASCLEQALEIKKVRVNSSHSSLAETEHILGSLYIKNERYFDAIPLLNSALSTYNQTRDCEVLSSDVLDLLGNAYAATGDLLRAISVYQQSLEIKRASLSPDHISCGNVLMEIGRLQVSNNDLEDSLVTFKEVKRLFRLHYKRDHLKNADMLVLVGSVQARRMNHDVALKCFMEALRIRRMLIQGKSNKISEILVHLGRVYQNMDDHKAAIQCFQQALGSSDEHDDTVAFTRRLLGTSFLKNEDYYDAVTCLEECLAVQDDSNNEWILIAYDLATAKIKSGKKDDAAAVLEKCIHLAKQNRLIDERLANALFQYGNVLCKDNSQKALCYFQEALAIKKDVGASPTELSEVLYEIGLIHEAMKQYHLSIESYQESLTLRQSTKAEDEKTADILFRLGEVYRVCGKLDLAFNSLTVALGAYYMAVGKNHTSVANTFHSLGYICDAKNDINEAIKNHKMGFEVRKLNLGNDHPQVADSLDDVAGLYQKLGDNKKALQCLKEGLRIRRLKSEDSMEVSTTLFAMGIIFAATNDNEKATECYNSSLNISSKHGSSPKLEAQTLHQIGCVLASQCEYREALQKWRKSLSKYREAGLSDDHYVVACTLGNIEMAENVLAES